MEPYLNDAPCLYFSATDDGLITEVNAALCRQLGFAKEELIGHKQDLIFTLPTRIFQQTHFFPLLKMQGHAEEIFITLQTKTKDQVPVLINAERQMTNHPPLTRYVGIIVNNRKKFEDELLAAKKAAEKALNENTALVQAKEELQKHATLLDQQIFLVNKQNAELRQFNHVVTHELQEPLRKLFVFINMLLEENNEAPIIKGLQKIKSVSEQMRAILSGLQQYVWLIETTPRRSSIQLKELVTAAVHELTQTLQEASFSLFIDEQIILDADKEQLCFLVQELLSNAVRFKKPHSPQEISVTASTIQLNQFRNINGRYHYGEFVKLEFNDNGLGFDPTYKEQVFELYKRLHTTSGRGVGLSLCKKVVESHDGTIAIDSNPGEGTTITVLLPLQPRLSAVEKQ